MILNTISLPYKAGPKTKSAKIEVLTKKKQKKLGP
jgi:hypothetical protein